MQCAKDDSCRSGGRRTVDRVDEVCIPDIFQLLFIKFFIIGAHIFAFQIVQIQRIDIRKNIDLPLFDRPAQHDIDKNHDENTRIHCHDPENLHKNRFHGVYFGAVREDLLRGSGKPEDRQNDARHNQDRSNDIPYEEHFLGLRRQLLSALLHCKIVLIFRFLNRHIKILLFCISAQLAASLLPTTRLAVTFP